MEYPLMKELGHEPFVMNCKEYEKLIETPVRQSLLDEYSNNDAERTVNAGNSTTF